MGILNRFTTVMKANINALLDKAEDPAKMVDQYLIDLNQSLAEVKKETASVIAEEKRTARLVEQNASESTRMESLAKKALQAGNEDDARTFLTKKQQIDATGEELKRTANAAHANADKMRQMHDKLVSDIDSLKTRRETIKAKSAVAKTQSRVNGLIGNDRADGAIDAFNRMEAKVDRDLDTATAMTELNEQPVDEAEALEHKYTDAADNAAVDNELTRLKSEMGL